jgi:hypothetical protein
MWTHMSSSLEFGTTIDWLGHNPTLQFCPDFGLAQIWQ